MTRRFWTIVTGILLCASLVGAEGPSRRERRRLADQGREALAQKQHSTAATLLEQATAPGAKPKNLARWLPLLGRAYEAQENYQKALASYQEAYRLRPKEFDRILDLARIYDRTELYDKAVELYMKAQKRDRHRRDVELALARVQFKMGHWDESRRLAVSYLRWEPRDLSAQRLMARIEEARKNIEQAAHRWEGILAQDPNAEEYEHLALLWSSVGQFDLAEEAFRKAESKGRSSALFHYSRGLSLWQKGDLSGAWYGFKKALSLDEDFLPAHFLLGLIDAEKGRRASARNTMTMINKTKDSYFKELAALYLAVDLEGAFQ